MSFAIWNSKPPFDEKTLNDGEKIYCVGDKWVVTDQGEPTQQKVDAVLEAAASPPSLSDGKLAALLVQKWVISAEEAAGG